MHEKLNNCRRLCHIILIIAANMHSHVSRISYIIRYVASCQKLPLASLLNLLPRKYFLRVISVKLRMFFMFLAFIFSSIDFEEKYFVIFILDQQFFSYKMIINELNDFVLHEHYYIHKLSFSAFTFSYYRAKANNYVTNYNM